MTDDIRPIVDLSQVTGQTTILVSVQRVLDYQNRCDARIRLQRESIERLQRRIEELEAIIIPPVIEPSMVTSQLISRIRELEEMVAHQQISEVVEIEQVSHVVETDWHHRLDTAEPDDEATVALAEEVGTAGNSLPLWEQRPGYVL
jgi:hypothetical protein